MFNYADVNTLSYVDWQLDTLINVKEDEGHVCLNWFSVNQKQANPGKFQAFAVYKKAH